MLKKALWAVIPLIVLVVTTCSVFIVTKPTEDDYVRWMKERYSARCLDAQCNAFDIDVKENGQTKKITMQNVHGGYALGTFVFQREDKFREFKDPAYRLDLKIKGYLGRFHVIKENKKLIEN